MAQVPIACNMGALTASQRQRHEQVREQLAQAVEAVHELPDGYAFRYRNDEALWLLAAEFVDRERRCCPFFRFTLTLEPNGDVWLQLGGSDQIKQFVAAEFREV